MSNLALLLPLAATFGNGLVSCVVGLIAIGGAIGLIRHYRTYTILNIVAIIFGIAALGSGLLEIARAAT